MLVGQSPTTTPNSHRRSGRGSSTLPLRLAGSTPINAERIRVGYTQQSDEDDGVYIDDENRTPYAFAGGEAVHRNESTSTTECRHRRLDSYHDNHSGVTMKALKEITGLVNGVAETVDAIKDELSQSKEKLAEKCKPPLGVKVYL